MYHLLHYYEWLLGSKQYFRSYVFLFFGCLVIFIFLVIWFSIYSVLWIWSSAGLV